MATKTLVLSLALNGYQWTYRKQLKTHKEYAKRQGYVYQAVTSPYFSSLGAECCWLKLTIIRAALLTGYERVLFVDADASINGDCPTLNDVITQDKFIYMAKGYSGRFNSGVLLITNNADAIDWLDRVIASRGQPVKAENSVGWGENGHVIELSKGIDFIKELDKKWNNTSDVMLDDFIRHTNCGPMRKSITERLFHWAVFVISARIAYGNKAKNLDLLNRNNSEVLMKETSNILSIYPNITEPSTH